MAQNATIYRRRSGNGGMAVNAPAPYKAEEKCDAGVLAAYIVNSRRRRLAWLIGVVASAFGGVAHRGRSALADDKSSHPICSSSPLNPITAPSAGRRRARACQHAPAWLTENARLMTLYESCISQPRMRKTAASPY